MNWKTSDGADLGEADCIPELLRARSRAFPDKPALMGVDGVIMTCRDLLEFASRVLLALNGLGIRRNDRIALVAQDGPDMAAAFLSIAACAACAPLNPAYRAEDFEFYLADLRARALVLIGKGESPARAVARSRGIPILDLPLNDMEGRLPWLEAILREHGPRREGSSFAEPEDVALVLHTSGTTSRPKIVPLTHRNLCRSARHIVASLALTPADRCLNVMPLFHIHGLIGATLSSLTAGANVVCAPGFLDTRFFEWVEQFRPTWYTAVPTMHQAVLARAGENQSIIARRPFRFVRSSSSALPPAVMLEMERVFSAPVIESYGMTEASHQMASNPLPPAPRKPGSVGQAAGPEIGIIGEEGNLLETGSVGEIVVRGPNVTAGYDNNPQANAAAFAHGWFRTGDQGYMDADGYLFITGRTKEIINRGGEKIAPREIDEALMDHPGVRLAVAFAVPHPSLGEDIAAAVVPKEGFQLQEAELREFARGRLAQFKVPSRVVVVKDVPKGSTGKIQRIGLAERLAPELAIPYEAPTGKSEHIAASVFSQILRLERVGRHDNFFALGGDSIRAMQATFRLQESLGIQVPLSAVFQYPTAAALAREIERMSAQQGIESLAAELGSLPPETLAGLLDEPPEDNQ